MTPAPGGLGYLRAPDTGKWVWKGNRGGGRAGLPPRQRVSRLAPDLCWIARGQETVWGYPRSGRTNRMHKKSACPQWSRGPDRTAPKEPAWSRAACLESWAVRESSRRLARGRRRPKNLYLDKRLHLQVEFDNLLVTDPDVDVLGSRHVGDAAMASDSGQTWARSRGAGLPSFRTFPNVAPGDPVQSKPGCQPRPGFFLDTWNTHSLSRRLLLNGKVKVIMKNH